MMIRTRRLLLRPTFAEDWREVFHGIADEGTVRMLARAPWPYLPEHAQEYCALAFDPFALRLGIALPGVSGCPLIGQIGIFREEAEAGRPWELGYWIAREHRRKGYVTEAIVAILDAANVRGIAEIAAGHFIDNPVSGVVLEKCGFVATGEIKEMTSAGRGGASIAARRLRCDLARRPLGAMMAAAA